MTGNISSNNPLNIDNTSSGLVTLKTRVQGNSYTPNAGQVIDKILVGNDGEPYELTDFSSIKNLEVKYDKFLKNSSYDITIYYRNKKITVSQDDSANGTLSYSDSNGKNTYSDETELPSATGTLTATPSNSSLLFDYWEIISPNGSVDVSKKDPTLNLTTLNPDDDTKIIAHYKSAFSITVKQNNDEYGNILFQNDTSSQPINSVTTLSESTGTLTANPKEGFALVNWSVEYSNGNVESFTEETIDLSTIGADNGTSITANYKIADGWVMIRYEVIDTENTINYPVKLKFIGDDDSTAVGDYGKNNDTQPILTEMVHVSAGGEAKGAEALMLDPKTKYEDGQYYKFMGWEEENGYLFTEETSYKPSKDFLEYYSENGNDTLIYRAESRQTKNFYLIVQYNENIGDGSNIYDGRTSGGILASTKPITSVIAYVGYATIGSDGKVETVKPFKNLDDKDAPYQYIPVAEIPLGYKFN